MMADDSGIESEGECPVYSESRAKKAKRDPFSDTIVQVIKNIERMHMVQNGVEEVILLSHHVTSTEIEIEALPQHKINEHQKLITVSNGIEAIMDPDKEDSRNLENMENGPKNN